MSAVPLAKAGIGSAMNHTTREVGGARGIAVFGSIVNSLYRSSIDLGGLDLPASATSQIQDSVGGAASVASQTGVDGGTVIERAASAFTHAFRRWTGKSPRQFRLHDEAGVIDLRSERRKRPQRKARA